MLRHIKLAALIAYLFVPLVSPCALAQDINFSVSPAEVRIDDLIPGEAAQFDLTIHNKDDVSRVFILTTFQPPQEEMRQGTAEFPHPGWVSFSAQQIRLAPNSSANATVTLAIPQERKWAGKDWEIWLGVAHESSNLLAVKLYVRCLVSTAEGKPNRALLAGIAVAIALLGYGGYSHFRRKSAQE
jgi:hypothetical protein